MQNLPKQSHQNDQDDSDNTKKKQKKPVSVGVGTEHARFTISDHVHHAGDESKHEEKKEQKQIKETKEPKVVEKSRQIELEEEVERAGVTVTKEEEIIPPDISKLVVNTGSSASSAQKQIDQTLKLPLSKAKITTGLHITISRSVRWLAVWCVRRLKKAHKTLRNF